MLKNCAKTLIKNLVGPTSAYDISGCYSNKQISQRCRIENARIIYDDRDHNLSIPESKPLRFCGKFIKTHSLSILFGFLVSQ